MGASNSDPLPPSANHVIVPGQGVGPISIGMYLDEVIRELGKTSEIYPAKGEFGMTTYWWGCFGVALEEKTAPVVKEVIVQCPSYRTSDGIGIGSSTFEAARQWGQPDSWVGGAYEKKGIRILRCGDNDYTICRIQVMSWK